jgi:membrane-associated phospholipid phosphatase
MKKICAFLLVSIIALTAAAQSLDYKLMKDINVKDRPKNLDNTFRFISNSSQYISAGAPFALLGAGIFSNNKNLIKQGEDAAISYAISSVATIALKNSIHRERPFIRHKDLVKLSNGGGMSFPSGHASCAFSIATSIALDNKQWYIRVPVITWASIVGYSRIDLGVHYPSDVLAGAVVGAASAYAGKKINTWLNKNKTTRRNLAMW